MNTIHKYPLSIEHFQEVWMPKCANILHVNVENNEPVLWAGVDTCNELASRKIIRVLTGELIPVHDNFVRVYIGTTTITRDDAPLVLHFFELV